MALSRYFGNMWADPWEVDLPSLIGDQFFGTIVPPEFMPSRSLRRWPKLQESGTSEVMNTDKEFRVAMDVQHFKPEELKITTKDNRIIINAKHEERPDEHGYIMREFTRQYVLPKDVDPKTVTSSLSPSGVLTLKAPKLALEAPNEKVIPITLEKSESK